MPVAKFETRFERIPMEGSRSPLHRLRALNCKSGPYSYTKGPPRYSLLSLEGNRTDINISR